MYFSVIKGKKRIKIEKENKVSSWGDPNDDLWGFEFVLDNGSIERIPDLLVHAEAKQDCLFLYRNLRFCNAFPDRNFSDFSAFKKFLFFIIKSIFLQFRNFQ